MAVKQIPKTVETLTHEEATRKNIPTAEYQSVMQKDDQAPVKVSYPRASTELANEKQARNRDLDPQLVWRGKDQQDWSDLVVQAPPLYIQEKVRASAAPSVRPRRCSRRSIGRLAGRNQAIINRNHRLEESKPGMKNFQVTIFLPRLCPDLSQPCGRLTASFETGGTAATVSPLSGTVFDRLQIGV